MSTQDRDQAIAKLRADPLVQKCVRQLTDERLRVRLTLLRELRISVVFHTNGTDRNIPVYFSDEDDLAQLAPSFKEIQSLRERVGDVHMRMSAIRRHVAKLWTTCENQIAGSVLVRTTKVTQRKSLLREILAPIAQRLDDADLVLAACDRKLKELDGAYFVLKEISEIGKAVVEARGAARRRTGA